nr:hypothetical protein [Tanacetum cinerariifolium]
MITLAEFMMIADVDNRPPMLEKSLYDSWKSRLVVPMFNPRDDPIACLNKEMDFLRVVASSLQPIVNLELPLIRETRPPFKTTGLVYNKFKGSKDKVMLVKVTWLGNALNRRGIGMLHGLRKENVS